MPAEFPFNKNALNYTSAPGSQVVSGCAARYGLDGERANRIGTQHAALTVRVSGSFLASTSSRDSRRGLSLEKWLEQSSR
jgi:hypothetical protein